LYRGRSNLLSLKRARLIAEKLFNEELQRLAINANLHDLYGCNTPVCVKAAKERQELLEAMNVLFGDKKQLEMFDDR
jgi:hypothetical protein